ncbi:FAD dependent sulfhydryl oxidase [Xylariales sp. PMI_506]|nr:FAD dependent sulfhydryl oxidase [Xylariales sp. PMI_506]
MAADAEGAAGATPPSGTALPPGMVLGKDGKPCRTCSSGSAFKNWTAQAKSMKSGAFPAAFAGGAAAAAATATDTPARDCPPDVETLGRSTWTLLHSIAATYPTAPSVREQSDLKTFMGLFSRLYPCWVCAEDFQTYIEKEQIRVGSRNEFGQWLCEAHNAVNVKLGKTTFDCSKWEERWRTGWKDGRCD